MRVYGRTTRGSGAAPDRREPPQISDLLRLQEAAGNAAVTRMLTRAPVYGPPLPGEWTPPGPAPEWATPDLRRKLTATVLAESGMGQEDEVRWIYLTLVTRARGEEGLKRSSAYSGPGFRYRLFLYTLGDPTFGATPLPPGKDYRAYEDVADYATNNPWWQEHGRPRAERLRGMVDEMIAAPEENPHPGWTGQGSLNDFNNLSNPDVYWKRARAYFWLQESGAVTDIWVKVLHGPLTTVIFDADSIGAYYEEHPLPDVVPLYRP